VTFTNLSGIRIVSEMDFLETAEEAARKAGEVLESWTKKFTAREKSPANLVTEADFAAQEVIYNLIHARYPDHNFLGEEGLAETNSDSPYRWVIDPLDGTSNYVHHFPYYAVSIGLECAGDLVAGVIFDPNRDELFSAVQGRGAALNGDPIRPTDVKSLGQAMVVASLPVGAGPDDPAVDRFLRVMPCAQTVQRTGSAALNLAYVAGGRMDAFWSSSLKPWDTAAGALLVTEAGGRITKMSGGPFDIEVPDLLASNGSSIHEELQQLLE
jgi:myo-inositol-1(or 4)-monophosphatase